MKGTHWAVIIGIVAIAAFAYYHFVWSKRHGAKLIGKGAVPKKGGHKSGLRHRFASIATHLGDAATGGAVSAAENAIAGATGLNVGGLIGG